jgi:hypothetical protein
MTDADFVALQLPAVDEWMRRRPAGQRGSRSCAATRRACASSWTRRRSRRPRSELVFRLAIKHRLHPRGVAFGTPSVSFTEAPESLGAGRTQTDNQAIIAPSRTAVPSIWHRLRKRGHRGIMRTSPVNDRGQCTWRNECKWCQKANVPFHLAFTLRQKAPTSPSHPCGFRSSSVASDKPSSR